MVFNATFNNISVILWRSVLLEETTVPGENHRSYSITWCIILMCLYPTLWPSNEKSLGK
jgi:hypothetical protein